MQDIELKPSQEHLETARKIVNRLEKRYQDNHPCPQCNSHNVHIECYAMSGGYVYGEEWCDDCKWKKITDTFPKKEAKS